MAALAPMPSASVRITVTARPLTLRSERTAKRRSVRKLMSGQSASGTRKTGEFRVVQQRLEVAVTWNLPFVGAVDLDRFRDRGEGVSLASRFQMNVGESDPGVVVVRHLVFGGGGRAQRSRRVAGGQLPIRFGDQLSGIVQIEQVAQRWERCLAIVHAYVDHAIREAARTAERA